MSAAWYAAGMESPAIVSHTEGLAMERGRLVISRRLGEGFALGSEIEVHVLKAKGHAVKVVVIAPKDIKVRRLELEPKKAA